MILVIIIPYTVQEIPSLLSLCRIVVAELIRSGHHLEQDELPISLRRYFALHLNEMAVMTTMLGMQSLKMSVRNGQQ